MKKFSKVILIVLAFALLVGTMFTMTACKDKVSLQDMSFEDGILSWDKDTIVDAASDIYKVVANGAEKVVQLSADGKKYFVNLADELKGNDFKVSIGAKGDKVKINQTIQFKHVPQAVVEVKNGSFDWSASAESYASYGSLVYDVILDGERKESTADTFYTATTGVAHTIAVRPRVYGSSDFYYAEWSAETTASVLSTPRVTDVVWTVDRNNDGSVKTAKATIAWTSPTVSGVEFAVKINNIEFTTTASTLDTSTVQNLDVANGFEISLQAKSITGTSYDSAVSEPDKYISLAPVKNLRMDDGVLYYDAVEGAAKYCIDINGEKSYSDNTFFALQDAINNYSIKVCAVPAEGYKYKENYGLEVLNVNLVPAPGIYYDSKAFFIYGNTQNVSAYQVRIEKESKVEGETVYTEVATFRQDVLNTIFNQYGFEEEGVYDVSVKAVANSTSGYGNSIYSPRYQVIRLGVIPGLTIEEIPASKTADNYLSVKLDEVKENADKVSRYQLYMDGTEISATSMREFRIPKPVTYDEGAYTFSIRTVSDDDGSGDRVILSSTDAASFRVYQLATPRDVTLNAKGSVSWTMPEPVNDALKGGETGYNSTFIGYQVVMLQSYHVDPDKNEFTFPSDLAPGEITVNVFAQSRMDHNLTNNERQAVKLSFGRDENGNVVVSEINNEQATVGNGDIVLSSGYSTTEIINQLAAPTDMSIENNILSWTGVEGSMGYNIYYAAVDGDEVQYYGINSEPIKSTNFRFDDVNYTAAENPDLFIRSLLQEGGCVINVVAIGNKGVELRNGERYSFDSAKSANVPLFRNSAPTGLKVTDSYLSWNTVPNASYYNIYDFGMLWDTAQSTSISVEGLSSGVHRLRVVACGDGTKYFDSDYSENLTIYRLDEMSITREGDEYVWPALPYAIHYQLTIDGVTVSIQANEEGEAAAQESNTTYYYRYKPTFLKPDAQTVVKYRTMANSGALNEAFGGPVIASAEKSFNQKVVRKDAPQFQNNEQSNFALDSNYGSITITANIGDAPAGCTYKYLVDTINYYSETKAFKYNEDKVQPGDYTIQVAYGANYFAEDGTYYLDSQYATGEPMVVKFLREPYGVNVTRNGAEYTVTWAAITGAHHYRAYYEVYVCNLDGSKGELLGAGALQDELTDPRFIADLSDVATSKTGRILKVYLVSVGNGTNVSFYTVAEAEMEIN